MTSTNDGKEVKSNQTSGQKGKSYYIELYKSLEARLSGAEPGARAPVVCEAWRRVHSLCQHSASSTHPHLLAWIQRHTAQTILQTDWQQSEAKEEKHSLLKEALDAFLTECDEAIAKRNGVPAPWETTLRERAKWFRTGLTDPWGHPVLKALVNSQGEELTDQEVIEWLKEEKGMMFATRLRQLAASRGCGDLALRLASAVMDRARALYTDDPKPSESETESPFVAILKNEAGFTSEVWDLVTDIEFILLYSDSRAQCIELAKRIPHRNAYQYVERLRSRLECFPREKKVWKNAKEVAILIAQVVIARCMTVSVCAGAARVALYGCARALVRLLPHDKLRPAAAALAAPAATARHIHTLAVAVHTECKNERRAFVCELYVRAITFGMNELERLKLKTEKNTEARSTEQTLSSWFIQLGLLLSTSSRMNCECILTAFSVHPTQDMYEQVKIALQLEPLHSKDTPEPNTETNSEFGSWTTDSRTQSNLVKTSETLNLKSHKQTNVLSTAIFSEGEALGLEAELCQDLAVLISGPRVKTLSWDMERELLLENCRAYMERTDGGTRALTTELKYLNLDPRSFQHLPEEDDDENDLYYGIEKGYEYLVENPQEIWDDSLWHDDPERTDTACSTEEAAIDIPKPKKKKSKQLQYSSEEEVDPLSLSETTRTDKQEKPHSKERSKERRKKKHIIKEKSILEGKDSIECKEHSSEKTKEIRKKEKKREKKERKKKEKSGLNTITHSSAGNLSKLVGLKVGRTDGKSINLNQYITDSDYDSQGKSSINSEGNDPNAVDTFYSIDKIKSMDKNVMNLQQTNMPKYNDSNLPKGVIVSATQTHKASEEQKLQTVIQKNAHELVAPCYPNKLSEDIKKNLKKIVESRQNYSNRGVDFTLGQLENMKRLMNVNKNIQLAPVNDNSYKSIKSPQVSTLPKLNPNMSRERQLNVLKDEVNNFLKICNQGSSFKQKSSNLSVETFIPINSSVEKNNMKTNNDKTTVQLSGNCSRKDQQYDMTKQHKLDSSLNNLLNKSVKPSLLNTPESPSQCQYKEFLKYRTAPEVTKEPIRRTFVSPSQIQFQEFLRQQNLNQPTTQVTNTIGTTVQQLPRDFSNQTSKAFGKLQSNSNCKEQVKHQESRKQHNSIRTFQQQGSLTSGESESQKQFQIFLKELRESTNAGVAINQPEKNVKQTLDKTSKQTNSQKKHDNTLNTFSRLSYLHKNKQNDNKYKPSPTNLDQASLLQSMSSEEIRNLGVDYSKISNIQAQGDIAIYKINKNASGENTQFERSKFSKQSSLIQNHPIMTDMLSSDFRYSETGKEITGTAAKSTPSSFSEKDHHDLMLLRRQQLSMKPKTAIPQNTLVNDQSISNVDQKTVLNQNSISDNPSDNVKQNSFNPNMTRDNSLIKTCNTTSKFSTTSELKKFRTVKRSCKSSNLKATVKDKKDNDNSKSDWESVLNALLAHKTTNRGPNALDIVLKKDSFEKRLSSNSNQHQKVVTIHNNGNTLIESCVKKECPKILSPPLQKEGTSTLKKSYQQDLKERQHKKITETECNKKRLKKMQLKTNEKPFPSVIQNGNDPFISGIPNSDFDLLGELMDDDLRKEIGELLEDDETYGMAMTTPKTNVVSNSDVFSLSHKINLDSANKPHIIVDTRQVHTINPLKPKENPQKISNSGLRTVIQGKSKSVTSDAHLSNEPQIRSNKLIANKTIISESGPNESDVNEITAITLPKAENCNLNIYQPQEIHALSATPTPNVVLIASELVYEPLALQVEQPILQNLSAYGLNSYIEQNQPSTNYVSINQPSSSFLTVSQKLTNYMGSNQTSPCSATEPVTSNGAITVPVIRKVPLSCTLVPHVPVNTFVPSHTAPQRTNIKNEEIRSSSELIKMSQQLKPNVISKKTHLLRNSVDDFLEKDIYETKAKITTEPKAPKLPVIPNIVTKRYGTVPSVTAPPPATTIQTTTVPSTTSLKYVRSTVTSPKDTVSVIIPTDTSSILAVPTTTITKVSELSVALPLNNKFRSEPNKSVHDLQSMNILKNKIERKEGVESILIKDNKICQEKTQLAAMDSNRIQEKRMLIKNRQIHYRCSNQPIALTYQPLTVPAKEKQILKLTNESHIKTGNENCSDNQSTDFPISSENKEIMDSQYSGVLNNDAEAKNNPNTINDSQYRRFLLRSSNSLKSLKPNLVPQFLTTKVNDSEIKTLPGQTVKSKEILKPKSKKTKKNAVKKSVILPNEANKNENILKTQQPHSLTNEVTQEVPDKVENEIDTLSIKKDQIKSSVNQLTSKEDDRSKDYESGLKIQNQIIRVPDKKVTCSSILFGELQGKINKNIENIGTKKSTDTFSSKINQMKSQFLNSKKVKDCKNHDHDSSKSNLNYDKISENHVRRETPSSGNFILSSLSENLQKPPDDNILQYKDKISFEELPNITNDPFKKCVRIRLPSGKTVRATISGRHKIDIDTIFTDPAIKAMILQSENNSKNSIVTHFIATQKYGQKNKLENQRPATPTSCTQVHEKSKTLKIDETIDLISDDEENTIQIFQTEFGNFKTAYMNEDVYFKHQIKLSQKCEVKINRCNSLQEILKLKVAKEKNVLEEKVLQLQESNTEVIEIDDSSNDSENNAHIIDIKNSMLQDEENIPKLTEKVDVLKDMLLKDLGVNETFIVSKNMSQRVGVKVQTHCAVETQSLNQIPAVEAGMCKVKHKECLLKIEKCDDLIKKMEITKNMCFVNLVRCDDSPKKDILVNNFDGSIKVESETRGGEKIDKEISVQELLPHEPILYRNGSHSIVDHFSESEDTNLARSSPSLIENLKLPLIISKDLNYNFSTFPKYISKCDAEWHKTKTELLFNYKDIFTNSVDLRFTKNETSQLDDISTDCESDIENNILPYESFCINEKHKGEEMHHTQSLVKILTNFFVNNGILIERLKINQEVNKAVLKSCKRKNEEIVDKSRQKFLKTENCSNKCNSDIFNNLVENKPQEQLDGDISKDKSIYESKENIEQKEEGDDHTTNSELINNTIIDSTSDTIVEDVSVINNNVEHTLNPNVIGLDLDSFEDKQKIAENIEELSQDQFSFPNATVSIFPGDADTNKTNERVLKCDLSRVNESEVIDGTEFAPLEENKLNEIEVITNFNMDTPVADSLKKISEFQDKNFNGKNVENEVRNNYLSVKTCDANARTNDFVSRDSRIREMGLVKTQLKITSIVHNGVNDIASISVKQDNLSEIDNSLSKILSETDDSASEELESKTLIDVEIKDERDLSEKTRIVSHATEIVENEISINYLCTNTSCSTSVENVKCEIVSTDTRPKEIYLPKDSLHKNFSVLDSVNTRFFVKQDRLSKISNSQSKIVSETDDYVSGDLQSNKTPSVVEVKDKSLITEENIKTGSRNIEIIENDSNSGLEEQMVVFEKAENMDDGTSISNKKECNESNEMKNNYSISNKLYDTTEIDKNNLQRDTDNKNSNDIKINPILFEHDNNSKILSPHNNNPNKEQCLKNDKLCKSFYDNIDDNYFVELGIPIKGSEFEKIQSKVDTNKMTHKKTEDTESNLVDSPFKISNVGHGLVNTEKVIVENNLQIKTKLEQSVIESQSTGFLSSQDLHSHDNPIEISSLICYQNTYINDGCAEIKPGNLFVSSNTNDSVSDNIKCNAGVESDLALSTVESERGVKNHEKVRAQITCGSTLQENVTLVYNGGSLKGSIYENPIVGKCYLFCDNVWKSKVFEDRCKNEKNEDLNEKQDNNDFDVLVPKITYSRRSIIDELTKAKSDERLKRGCLKRKIISYENKLIKRYRKGKNIDYPKFTVTSMAETAYAKEYKRLFDYFSVIKFSLSRSFHKEYVDVSSSLQCWPITVPHTKVSDINESDYLLFNDDDNRIRESFDPMKLSLAEEMSSKYVESQSTCDDINEINFSMGFGERSDRVIKNLVGRDNISKFSAAALSDVKQSQPLLVSDDYKSKDRGKDFYKSRTDDQIEIFERYFSYIKLRDKVRSFFRKTTLDLHYNWLEDNMKNKNRKYEYNGNNKSPFPYDLFSSDFIEPAPIEASVHVVQVGQLPVSAAAQNPITCDPRVTQVTDASPSQCSAENSPHEDSQSPIKTEYTELTTADLSSPLVQEYERQIESQASKVLVNNENIPVEIEVSSGINDNVNEGLSQFQDGRHKCNNASDDLQALVNKHIHNIEYSFDSNENIAVESQSNTESVFGSVEKQNSEITPESKQQNGLTEKTDQIAHAMNAAGITTSPEPTITENTTTQTLVNIFSQNICQEVPSSIPQNNFAKTMTLQQALAQILPPTLNQTNSQESNQVPQNSSVTSQVLHIVQGKNTNSQITVLDNTQNSVISNSNTPILHIVHNKAGNSIPNSAAVQHANTYNGLSLVDTGLQQGNNQLLHIFNTSTQKNNTTGQLLKRVNLLTNLTNVQGTNEQKMVQFVCKSADGKSIQLNAPHQRSMVLRLQPFESTTVQSNVKTQDNQDVNSSSMNGSAINKESISAQHEIKSRSMYEENYAKFIQSSSNKAGTERSTSLPKFNQAFGKQVFQEGNQKASEVNTNSSHLPSDTENECQSSESTIHLDHIGQINSPPLLLRKSPAQTTQTQSNIVQQIKQTISPMMHGGVIYTRQIPVNIGGGQTINLITVPSTELVDDANQKQHGDIKFVSQGEIDSPIIKIVPQNQNTELKADESNNHQSNSMNENTQNTPTQHQPVLTQMRIKLPMLSKSPQMVSGTRVVRPSFFQIQRNVIGGANQPVYQQLVLTAAPSLGQHSIHLPQAQTRQVKVTTENQSSPESQMSSSTLEQLREFDMVLEQVKERSTVQPNCNSTFSKINISSTDTTDSTSATSTVTESTQKVLYTIGANQSLNVAYVNRKPNAAAASATTFVRSPDSSGILDSPSSSGQGQIPHTVTSESTGTEVSTQQTQPKAAKVGSKSRSRPKSSTHPPNSLKINTPPKTSNQKPLEDEQTTQRILYILAEYKEKVQRSPNKDKPAPRRRSHPPSNPSGSSKRKKSSSSSRRAGARDGSPIHGEDACRTMGSEDSSCGTSQGDCTESCLETHSPQDSPRKVARKLTFDNEASISSQPRTPQQRNVIVADGQTITVSRGTSGKPATAVLMPANYILPVSMVKGGQQIAIVTNRGPKLLTMGGGEGGSTNALLLQRLIGPGGLKPMLARSGVRHVRLHNLQQLAAGGAAREQERAASPPGAPPTPPDVKPERGSSPEDSEPWHLSADPNDYSYEEIVRTENMDRTVLDAIPDRYSPDMEAQRIFDKMFDVDSKKSYIVDSQDDSSRCAYDLESDCDDKPYHQVVHKRDGQRHHRLSHVTAAALRHKYAVLEHELRLQKSLSEECEDLGVDSPSASELFPEAELLFSSSPAPETQQQSQTPLPTIFNQSTIPQPDIDDQIATDHLLQHVAHDDQDDLGITLGLDEGIVTVSEDGMHATIAIDQEEFARSHPNTTFHSEPSEEGEVQPYTITGFKGRHITSTIFHAGRAPATVLVSAPHSTVISRSGQDGARPPVKFDTMEHVMHSSLAPHPNLNLSSVLVNDNILTDSRELHLSNTVSTIVHSTGTATQVIRRVRYGGEAGEAGDAGEAGEGGYSLDSDALLGEEARALATEDSSRDATLESMPDSSPERHGELFWESNSASASETRRPLDFSSDSDKCPYEETNSTDSSGVGEHVRLDSVIKEARPVERAGSGSSSEPPPPLRTYPVRRYHHRDVRAHSLSGKTSAGFREAHAEDAHDVRRRASVRGVVKRGCQCCGGGSPAPPRPKKPKRKPTVDFNCN